MKRFSDREKKYVLDVLKMNLEPQKIVNIIIYLKRGYQTYLKQSIQLVK